MRPHPTAPTTKAVGATSSASRRGVRVDFRTHPAVVNVAAASA